MSGNRGARSSAQEPLEQSQRLSPFSRASTRAPYRSYSYLDPGADFQPFELDAEIDRVPEYELGLTPEQSERVGSVLKGNIVISLHDHPVILPKRIEELPLYNRTGRQHTAYAGLAKSGLTAVFDNLMAGMGCITSANGWKWSDIVFDLGMRLSDLAHQEAVTVARRLEDIQNAKERGQVALIFGLEAATPIENELDRLDVLYGLGIRQIGIAYSESNALGSGLKERADGGLSVFGRKAVERMNKLGMAIDVSHSGDRTALETIEASRAPVFITHAGARGVWDSPRMKPDDVLLECAERGGVLGIEASPHTTISKEHRRHSLESIMDHFQYAADLMGIEHVAFGPDTLYGDHVGLHRVFSENLGVPDFNRGLEFEMVPYVSGMENATEAFGNIAGWLVKHGYDDEEITAVIGGNIMRVLSTVWA